MRKFSIVCDNCGTELRSNKDIYHITFESCKFTDAAGDIDTDVIRLDLCAACCKNAVTSLKLIAEKTEAIKKIEHTKKVTCKSYRKMDDDDPYRTFGYNGHCWGTHEIDPCKCGGDRCECDFYAEVREKPYV